MKKEGSLGAEYLEEREHIRVEKLGLKINLIAILLPCVLVIILTVAYLDLKSKITSIRDTGTSKVENLSMDLDSQVRGLLGKYKNAEKNFTREVASSKKTVSQIKKIIDRNRKNINKVYSSKADKAALTKEIEGGKTRLSRIRKEIAQSRSLLEALQDKSEMVNKDLRKSRSEISDLKSELSKAQKNLVKLNRNKAEKTEELKILAELKKVKRDNKRKITGLNNSLNLKYSLIDKKIKNFDKKIKNLEKKLTRKKIKKKKVRKKKVRKKKRSTKKVVPKKKTVTKKIEPKKKEPKPGEIIETDIK